ncbi:MAG: hypothetical protein HYY06_26045 [Deltaproteobacteria bacterium]|nr:hypothetical protein [Deltaproteobacteria bacterium]
MPADANPEIAYQEYLARYESLVGHREVGQYGKWGKHLVKKYSAEEFRERYEQFMKLEGVCRHIVETGATMNDAVTAAYKEAAAEILLEPEAMNVSVEKFRG